MKVHPMYFKQGPKCAKLSWAETNLTEEASWIWDLPISTCFSSQNITLEFLFCQKSYKWISTSIFQTSRLSVQCRRRRPSGVTSQHKLCWIKWYWLSKLLNILHWWKNVKKLYLDSSLSIMIFTQLHAHGVFGPQAFSEELDITRVVLAF